MVSNILSWVELLRSGVVSELQKTRQKYVQMVWLYNTKMLYINITLHKDGNHVTCLLSGHRESCCSWCTVYWRTPASGRAHSPTVWLVSANLHIRQSKQTQINTSALPRLSFSYKIKQSVNWSKILTTHFFTFMTISRILQLYCTILILNIVIQ